ncbi:hypothetical protein AYO44_14335 [Planctomycetaceae bacterium SCGC AG-212-F19]|nr:hypothetical protein AYO44_14335 [Planctomycetaceae bacterium SCGC AG-212-F19]
MAFSHKVVWAGIGWMLWAGSALAAPPADFETQVVPVLTRAGCNSGSCHGAAIGRGGLHLSLLGYDPEADYEALVHEYKGRRVHLAKPEKSLVLTKPSRQLPHEGGRRLPADGDGHAVLLDWIKAGAPREPRRSLQALTLSPRLQTLAAPGETFTLKVSARFSDGSQEDVTRWALLTPIDSAALTCGPTGAVTALRRGQSSIMVRYLGAVDCVTVVVPMSDRLAAGGERPQDNFIDDFINRKLDLLRLPHSSRADEEVLLRRVYLDLIGALPQPSDVDAYLADQTPDKFARLVERLFNRAELIDRWAYYWGDLLRIESRRLQPEGAAAFHGWVREQVGKNTGLDRMARELLLATGDGHRVGPANFTRVPADARAQAEHVAQVFLGVRLQCANCHNHPLDRWTQDDYHGLAAVFARLSRNRVVEILERGEVTHPKTGKAAVPRIPGERFLADRVEPREELANWLTAPANPFVARAAVNRLWRELMGRGLVEPVDDHRATNPPTHPELLDQLARDFVAHRFDLRHTLRTIVLSAAYQRSSLSVAGNQTDDRFYSRALVRPLPPTVMMDAVATVTGVADKFGSLKEGTTALSLGDTQIASLPLDLLGRCGRANGCAAVQPSAGSLPLTLHKINGSWLNDKIAHPEGRLHRLLRDGKTDEAVIAELYQAALSRKPTSKELAHWTDKLGGMKGEARVGRFEDFFWALLNATEFGTNH